MSETIQTDVQAVFRQVFDDDSIDIHERTTADDIDGWDSLKGVRLVLRLEEIVGRELSEDDIEKLQSIEDVDRLLKVA